jgi:hypothetical protein
MSETWIIMAVAGLFALFLGRSAIIAFWPESEAAKFCEARFGFMDRVADGDGDDRGGDGGGD